MDEYPNLSKDQQNRANKEKEKLKEKAVYWHNSIPNFDHDMRGSLTKDLGAVVGVEQLELNRKLYLGIQLNNWINIFISAVNLVLLAVNIYLLTGK